MTQGQLFEMPAEPAKTCKTCIHRQPFEFPHGGKVSWRCDAIASPLSANGRKIIKVNGPACHRHEEKK